MKENNLDGFMKGVMALITSQVIIKILGLMYSIYLTNKEGFGDNGNAIYMSGYQIYALLLTISSIGVPNAISKLVSEKIVVGDIKGADKIFKVSIVTFGIIGFFGTVTLYSGAKIISNIWLEIPEAEYTLKALSPAIFFVSISSVVRGYFNGKQKVYKTANSQTVEQFLKTTLTILFVEIISIFTTNNTELMAAGANLATAFSTFFSFLYIYKVYRINKVEEYKIFKRSYASKETIKEIIKKVLAVSIPISLSSFLSSINKNIDSVTVVRLLKPILGEATAKARYGILSSKVDILTAMPLAFNIAFATSLVPVISGSMVKKDFKTINEKLRLSILITILIGLPCTFGLFIYSNQILKLLFPNASSGGTLLALSSITIIFTSLTQTINGALQGIGKIKVPAIALACGGIVKLVVNLIFIPMDCFYEKGAIIGNIFCNITSYIIVYSVLKKSIKLEFNISKLIIKPLIISIIMFVVSYNSYLKFLELNISDSISTIIGIFIGVVTYVLLVILLRIFSKKDIYSFPKGEKIYLFFKKIKLYK